MYVRLLRNFIRGFFDRSEIDVTLLRLQRHSALRDKTSKYRQWHDYIFVE